LVVHAANVTCSNNCTNQGLQINKGVDQTYAAYLPALVEPGHSFRLYLDIGDWYHDSAQNFSWIEPSTWMGGISWSGFNVGAIQNLEQEIQDDIAAGDYNISHPVSQLDALLDVNGWLSYGWGSWRTGADCTVYPNGVCGTPVSTPSLTAPSSPGYYKLWFMTTEFQEMTSRYTGETEMYFDDPVEYVTVAVGYPSSSSGYYAYSFDGCVEYAPGNPNKPAEWIDKWWVSNGTWTLVQRYQQDWDVPSQCDPLTATWHLAYAPTFYTQSAEVQGYVETAPTPAHLAESWVQWDQQEGWNGKSWYSGAQQLPTDFPAPQPPGTGDTWTTCLAIQGPEWYYDGPLAGHGWYAGAWGPWRCNAFTAIDGVPTTSFTLGAGDTAIGQPVPYLNPGPSGSVAQSYVQQNVYVPPGTSLTQARWTIQGPSTNVWGYDTYTGWGNYNWRGLTTYTWPSAVDLPTNYTEPGLWTVTLQVQDSDGAWSPVVSEFQDPSQASQRSFTVGSQSLGAFTPTGCAGVGTFSGFVPDTYTYWTGSWPTAVSEHQWLSDNPTTQATTTWCQPTTIPISNQPTSCVPRDPGWAYWTRRYETALTFPTGPVDVSSPLANTYPQYDPEACPVPEGY
jgi:hypothetical protein